MLRVTDGFLRKRLVISLLILSSIFFLLIGRLAFIQIIQAPWLTERAKDLWGRDLPVEPKRGTIYDRNGEVLAYNGSAPTVVAVPAQIKDKEGTAIKLAQVLGMNRDKVLNAISKRTLIVYLAPQGRKMDDAKAKEVRALQLPGIYITEEGKRSYPYDTLAAHVLGFAGVDNQGLTGLELKYEKLLKGTPGRITFYANARGEEMPKENDVYVPPVDGENLTLTIDAQISTFVQKELENVVAQYHPDNATAIVVDPKTGEVLALENYPTFKPYDYQNYSPDVYNRNLGIWKTFEPGSTFKIVTLAAALEEKKVNLKDSFFDPGYYEVAGHRIRCWKAGGHGQETFLDVVENSCNPGFIVMGQRLGKEVLFDYIRKFGFGQKTGIDMPGESNGILFKLSQVGPLELATTSFGQGVSVTPIQQVMAVSAVANGGLLMEPHVAKEWTDPHTGKVLKSIQPVVKRRVILEETAKEVRETLESVVARGTGRNAFLEGYRVAGKTGTAQVAEGGGYKSGHYIVSFIGMAPADNPRLVAYIAVDNPKGPLIFGGTIAAPAVGHILADSLQYMNVQPSKEGIQREYIYGEVKPIEIPQIAGLTVEEARKEMLGDGSQLKVEVVGAGKYIVAQSPAAGTKVAPDSTVRIYLSDQPTLITPPASPPSTSDKK